MRVTGPNHDPETATAWVNPGSTTSEEIALFYKPVSFDWTVNETEIIDRYEVTLNLTFETDLLIANVVATPPSVTVPPMDPGDVLQRRGRFQKRRTGPR